MLAVVAREGWVPAVLAVVAREGWVPATFSDTYIVHIKLFNFLR